MHEISNNMVCAYAQSDHSLCQSLDYSMNVQLLAEHHLEFLSLKGGWRGSSESTYVKMPHYWNSHAAAHLNQSYYDIQYLVGTESTRLTVKVLAFIIEV